MRIANTKILISSFASFIVHIIIIGIIYWIILNNNSKPLTNFTLVDLINEPLTANNVSSEKPVTPLDQKLLPKDQVYDNTIKKLAPPIKISANPTSTPNKQPSPITNQVISRTTAVQSKLQKNSPPQKQLNKELDSNEEQKSNTPINNEFKPKNNSTKELNNQQEQSTQLTKSIETQSKSPIIDEFSSYEANRSLTLTKKPYLNLDNSTRSVQEYVPTFISPELRDNTTDKTNYENLNYVLSDYNWSYKTYVEQWARKIIDWWVIPGDYASGLKPEGGSVWVSAIINKKGRLVSFSVDNSGVTPEMEAKAIQALISSFEIPQLSDDFPKQITFHWHFIYPVYGPVFSPQKKR